MVHMDMDLLRSSKQMKPRLQCRDDCQQFLLSNGVSCFPAGCIFRDRKATGRKWPLYFPRLHCCANVAPMQSFEASVYRWYGRFGTMALRCAAASMAFFKVSNAIWCIALHSHSKSFFNIAVS